MNKTIIIALILLGSSLCSTAENKSHLTFKVDERVELASIVCNVADIEEYHSAYVPYKEEIDGLSKFSDHQFVEFVKHLNKENTLNKQVFILANLLLEFRDNKFQIKADNKKIEKLLLSYITANEYKTYVELLNKFYKDANMSNVFKNNQMYFNMQEKNIILDDENINLRFFESMLGKPFGECTIFVDTEYPTPEHFNFNPIMEINGNLDLVFYDFKRSFCTEGKTCYISYHYFMDMSVVYVLTQSYVSEYAKVYQDKTLDASKVLYAKNKNLLDAKRIDAENIWGEYVTNVFLGLYGEKLKSKNIPNNILKANNKAGLVEYQKLLDYTKAHFTNNRKQYPTFQSFLPALSEYYKQLAN